VNRSLLHRDEEDLYSYRSPMCFPPNVNRSLLHSNVNRSPIHIVICLFISYSHV